MAETISQHQQSAFTTPINGANADASVVLSNDNTLRTAYNAHDADAGVHLQSSTAAGKPAASVAGRKWMTSDTLRIYYDSGSAWNEAGYIASSGYTGQIRTDMTGQNLNGLVVVNPHASTPQMLFGYDSSNYFTAYVSSAGAVTIDAVGGSAGFTFSDPVTISTTLTVGGASSFTGDVALGGNIRTATGRVSVGGDPGGLFGYTSLTGTNDVSANSTGVGTILFKGTTSRNSTGFIKVYVGTTAYYVPFFSAITG